MMQELQKYVDKLDIDFKGVKIWLYVFWNIDGSIDYMGYLLCLDSCNVDEFELVVVFKIFMKKYSFLVIFGKKFSYYIGVNFFIYSEKVDN